MFYSQFNNPAATHRGVTPMPKAMPGPNIAPPTGQPGAPQLVMPQDNVWPMVLGHIMQLRITDPPAYHRIAKQFGLPPYDQHGTHPGATGEFVGQFSGQPGQGQFANYENRF
jgi:hypothetical protein